MTGSGDDRALVMARIREALAPLETRAAMPKWSDESPVARKVLDAKDVVTAFTDQVAKASGRVFTDARALARWLVERKETRGYCDPALLPELEAALSEGLTIETAVERGRIDDLRFGITRAAGAIAETGTVILDDATTSSRLAALAPWIHVAVVRRSTLHARVADAVRALKSEMNVVWCTGPSKTADVEGILIEGVHGPGEQITLLLA
ncbi:MAG TPA: LUD domain-containing protein [Polyangiaceae bacterium]|jgi:L-lactate dehydrogenase complex protein LldG